MALTWEERESVTNDYFKLDNGKACDTYFNTSFALNYLLKQQKGLWERPEGGEKIRVPIEYDEQGGGFYSRGDPLDSDDRESVNSAYFDWKHAWSNATIYRIDTLKNAGDYAEVSLVQQRTAGAQKTITKVLADSFYDEPGGNSKRLTGVRACCHATTTTAFGNIQEADLVAADGSTPWKGRRTTTTEGIALDVIRDLRTAAKLRDGPNGKPDLLVSPEELWNVIASILQLQQRFTKSDWTAKAGFTGIEFEGCAYFPDDYCPSGYLIGLNSKHIGFAVHQQGYFMRTPWDRIPDSPMDKTMKLLFDGNIIVDNRKAHIAHSNLS